MDFQHMNFNTWKNVHAVMKIDDNCDLIFPLKLAPHLPESGVAAQCRLDVAACNQPFGVKQEGGRKRDGEQLKGERKVREQRTP